MNERRPTWKCPVCNKTASFESLMIDRYIELFRIISNVFKITHYHFSYFQEVLQSDLLSSDTNEIKIHKDGTCTLPNNTIFKPSGADRPRKPLSDKTNKNDAPSAKVRERVSSLHHSDRYQNFQPVVDESSDEEIDLT